MAQTGRRRRADGELTRRRVLDAALSSILEKGYYETSSNEVARRAGVTWGAIQHLFGTREALLLDLLNERWAQLQASLAVAEITGVTLEERLGEVLDVLAAHYGDPAYVAHLQIALDLRTNPNTSDATRRAVEAHGERLTQAFHPLFHQALGAAAADRELVGFAFTTLRGYLSAGVIAGALSDRPGSPAGRDMIVRAVAAVLREEAASRGLALDQTA